MQVRSGPQEWSCSPFEFDVNLASAKLTSAVWAWLVGLSDPDSGYRKWVSWVMPWICPAGCGRVIVSGELADAPHDDSKRASPEDHHHDRQDDPPADPEVCHRHASSAATMAGGALHLPALASSSPPLLVSLLNDLCAFHAGLSLSWDHAVEDVLTWLVDFQVRSTGGGLCQREMNVGLRLRFCVQVLASTSQVRDVQIGIDLIDREIVQGSLHILDGASRQ